MKEIKRFPEWIGIKSKLHDVGRVPAIHEGEIWWAALGENIGVEINGKSDMFSRPVLILKKLSRFCFMAIPLTSKTKTGSWYATFEFQGKTETAVLVQARVMSVSRLYRKMGSVPESDLLLVHNAFLKLYS